MKSINRNISKKIFEYDFSDQKIICHDLYERLDIEWYLPARDSVRPIESSIIGEIFNDDGDSKTIG